jgi:alkaline phosphatase
MVTAEVARAAQPEANWQDTIQKFRTDNPAKHIILFIGDGMQFAHEIATSRYLFGRDQGLLFHTFPFKHNVTTWDVTTYNRYAGSPAYDPSAIDPSVGYDPTKGGPTPYPRNADLIDDAYFLTTIAGKESATDSASAATAWATGYKTEDGNIAWLPGDPVGGSIPTVAEILRSAKGMAIGVVSTVPFSHATPAAHVSHNVSRNNYLEIAQEILTDVKPEVVIGGGHPSFNSNGFQYISQPTYDTVKADPNYVVAERQTGVDGGVSLLQAAQQAAAQGRKLFGLYGGAGGNFESPVPLDAPGLPTVQRATIESPTLSQATLAALHVLSRDEDGFFVMIEQGDIDWANHANDFQRMVGTTWDLGEAVRAAVDFVNRVGDDVTWDNTLILVTADHANSYTRLVETLGAGDLPTQDGSCSYGGPACTYPDGDVTYGTENHTNELVRLYAVSNGATLLSKHVQSWYSCHKIVDNTQIFHVMTAAAGAPQPSPLTVIPVGATCN